jgi:alpha-beta hydrolase superfamily lysophospholipase
MRSERFDFPCSGNRMLAGRLDLPDGEPRAYGLFAHCFACGKGSPAAVRIAEALAADGIGTLRFDFTGLGESEGEFANAGFSSNVEDLVAAADHLRSTRRAPGILIGHSLGGSAVIAAARFIPEARAVAVIGAPFEINRVERSFGSKLEELERDGEATVDIAGRQFRIRNSFVEDLKAQDQKLRLRELNRALLIFHATEDNVVPLEDATRIFEYAKQPKSFISLPGANHLLTHRKDAQYVADILAAWAARYLGGDAPIR